VSLIRSKHSGERCPRLVARQRKPSANKNWPTDHRQRLACGATLQPRRLRESPLEPGVLLVRLHFDLQVTHIRQDRAPVRGRPIANPVGWILSQGPDLLENQLPRSSGRAARCRHNRKDCRWSRCRKPSHISRDTALLRTFIRHCPVSFCLK